MQKSPFMKKVYKHTENISLGSQPNRYYLMKMNMQKFSNPRLVRVLKHPGVMRQIPGLTSLPSTSTAKKSAKITFSADKIYYNLSQEYPNITNKKQH